MKRLEGVVRTKTAEGAGQLWVLALFPFVIFVGFRAMLSPAISCPCRRPFRGTASRGRRALLGRCARPARKVLAVDL